MAAAIGAPGSVATTTLNHLRTADAERPGNQALTRLIHDKSSHNPAWQLVSQHPGLKFGPWEIRPAGDLKAMVEESKRRRGKDA